MMFIDHTGHPFRQIPASAVTPVTLHIDLTETLVQWQVNLGRETLQRRLPFGCATVFGPDSRTLTALALESAIELVEEHVMPLAREITTPSRRAVLVQGYQLDASIRDSVGVAFDLDSVEREFSHIAAVAQGRPCSSMATSKMLLLAADVLIVREFMHHVGIGHGRLNYPAN